MQSKFAAKRVGTLNKFFTKVSVGTLLAQQFDETQPKNVVDLGCGEGSLTASVVRRWQGVEVVTVDLDASTGLILQKNLVQVGCTRHTHHVHDAMDASLPSLLGGKETFDLAVCNPPFFNPQWAPHHDDILHNAGLGDASNSATEVTAEILFMAQSLALLKDGGRLAIIVPDGLVTASRAKNLRRALLHNHSVERVIQLPLNSFLETDAQCFIILIRKGCGPTCEVKLLNVETVQGLTSHIIIDRERAESRMDYNFHSLRSNRACNFTTLRALGADIFRGSISTVQRKGANYPVFHTSDYKHLTDGRIELPELTMAGHSGRVVAEAGDILLARVDRNLHEKIGLVKSGSAVLTDCVYRIRLPEISREHAYSSLCSETGRANLRALTKGVGARIIGKADLLDMPLYID